MPSETERGDGEEEGGAVIVVAVCFLMTALTAPDMLALYSAHSAAFTHIFFHTSPFRLKYTFWILTRRTIICHPRPSVIIFPSFPKMYYFFSFGRDVWSGQRLEDKRQGIELNFCPASEKLQCSDKSVRPHLALNCHGKLRLPFVIKRGRGLTLISGPVKTPDKRSFHARFQSPSPRFFSSDINCVIKPISLLIEQRDYNSDRLAQRPHKQMFR